MRKLRLNMERIGELTTDELVTVVGGTATGDVCNIGAVSVKESECGWTTCLNTTPINQCLITIGCNNTA